MLSGYDILQKDVIPQVGMAWDIFFSNFGRICMISLYKVDTEDWEFLGLRFGDRSCVPLVASGKAERSIQCSAINCLKEHPTLSHRLFRGSLSDAKIDIISHISKCSVNKFTPSLLPHDGIGKKVTTRFTWTWILYKSRILQTFYISLNAFHGDIRLATEHCRPKPWLIVQDTKNRREFLFNVFTYSLNYSLNYSLKMSHQVCIALMWLFRTKVMDIWERHLYYWLCYSIWLILDVLVSCWITDIYESIRIAVLDYQSLISVIYTTNQSTMTKNQSYTTIEPYYLVFNLKYRNIKAVFLAVLNHSRNACLLPLHRRNTEAVSVNGG